MFQKKLEMGRRQFSWSESNYIPMPRRAAESQDNITHPGPIGQTSASWFQQCIRNTLLQCVFSIHSTFFFNVLGVLLIVLALNQCEANSELADSKNKSQTLLWQVRKSIDCYWVTVSRDLLSLPSLTTLVCSKNPSLASCRQCSLPGAFSSLELL